MGELFNLPPSHVRLPEKIHIGPSAGWVPKGYPRSRHGVRDVPIHQEALLPLLEEYSRACAGKDYFFLNPRTGEKWAYNTFAKWFATDVRAAGLTAGQRRGGVAQPDGITPHTLRHTLASWLAESDVQLMKIAAILGDTEETVSKHYAHLLPGDLDRTIQRLFSDSVSMEIEKTPRNPLVEPNQKNTSVSFW